METLRSKLLWAVFLLLLCVHAAGNALWLSQNGNRAVGHAFHTRHFMRAAEIHDRLKDGTPFSRIIPLLYQGRFNPPPLHSITTGVGMLVLGKNVPLLTWILNLLYLALALFFIRRLTEELGQSSVVVAWAMVLYALYPAVYGLSRLYGAFDFQVAGMMPVAVWCLLKTRQFSSRPYTLLLAAVMAASLLIKDTFAGYFAAMFFYAASHAWLCADRNAKRNILLLLVAVAVAISPYYAHTNVLYKVATEPFRESGGSYMHDWGTYTIGLSENLLAPPFFLLFLGSLIWFIRRRPLEFTAKILLAWILAPWTILVFMHHYKQLSYFVPLLPAAAIISAMGLCALPGRLRKPAMTVCLSVGLLQYAAFSFGLGNLFHGPMRRETGSWSGFPTYFVLDPGIIYHRGVPQEFDVYQDVTGKIAAAKSRPDERILVLKAVDASAAYYHFLGWLYGLGYVPMGGGEFFRERFLAADYDKVILPLRPGWSTADYVRCVFEESQLLARRNWFPDITELLEKTDQGLVSAKLDVFLKKYPRREELGSDGRNVLWLLSKR